ncbi:MAG: PTS sugar transporter subunit IIA [Brevinemataceae bacterium]
MNLNDILIKESFHLGMKSSQKEDIIQEIAQHFADTYNLDKKQVFTHLWNREQKGSTGLGKGLAVPHSRIPNIGDIKLAVFYSKEGKDFNAYDHLPTHLFFAAIIDEEGHPQEQLEILRIIVECCEHTDLMAQLQHVESTEELRNILLKRIQEVQNN